MDFDKILLDYDEDSQIGVFNDACAGADQEKPKGYTTYKGTAEIKTFFTNLFAQLQQNISNAHEFGPQNFGKEGAGAVVKEATNRLFFVQESRREFPHQFADYRGHGAKRKVRRGHPAARPEGGQPAQEGLGQSSQVLRSSRL